MDRTRREGGDRDNDRTKEKKRENGTDGQTQKILDEEFSIFSLHILLTPYLKQQKKNTQD